MILVVGGAGYIGSHCVKLLMQHNYDCVVLDNLSYGHKEAVSCKNFEIADLMDKNSLKKVFEKYNITAVMHFAAYTYVGESVQDPQKYYQNNIIGTLNLLQVMLEHNVKKIIFSSSCATYGDPKYLPLDENHPQNPINPYGYTKLVIEQALQDYHKAYGLSYIALRYFNASGASADNSIGESHNPETHLIPLVLKAILGKIDNVSVFGSDYNTFDGTCLRDYIHVEDLATAHMLALQKVDDYCGHLNLGTGIPISVKQIIDVSMQVSGKKCPFNILDRRPGDPDQLYASNSKAKAILGWQPRYMDIAEIIHTALNWEQNKGY